MDSPGKCISIQIEYWIKKVILWEISKKKKKNDAKFNFNVFPWICTSSKED